MPQSVDTSDCGLNSSQSKSSTKITHGLMHISHIGWFSLPFRATCLFSFHPHHTQFMYFAASASGLGRITVVAAFAVSCTHPPNSRRNWHLTF